MKYYIITAEDASTMRLTRFRRGGKDGYVVTSGDMVTAPDHIKANAIAVTEQEAREFLKTNEK